MMVIRENQIHIDIGKIYESNHFADERKARKNFIKNISDISEMEIQNAFWVNKGHPNGPEIHLITKDAFILVINARTFKLCTVLIARPGQIIRYYEKTNKKVPERLLAIARYNQKKGLNNK